MIEEQNGIEEEKFEHQKSIHLDNLDLNSKFNQQEILAKQQIQDNQLKGKKVLIIVTGGTICMNKSERGYVVQPNFIENFMKQNPDFYDADYAFFHSENGFLITPETMYGQRIRYKIIEYEKIIDSCNMNVDKYYQIGRTVLNNYHEFDSFIILHGTDTMAYTASVLSFMFENLNKTVIITGSQVPLSMMRNDGYQNLMYSLIIAGHYKIPEVMILFRRKLIRGNRSRKFDCLRMDAFDSPNFEFLGDIGINIEIHWNHLMKAEHNKQFQLWYNENFCDKIAVVKYNPLISMAVLQPIFQSEQIKAVIIESFGAGNLPTNRTDILELIKDSIAKGMIVVNISQCYKYRIDDVYETGKQLSDMGIINGMDMTLEAVLAKLGYLLGKNLPNDEIRKMLQTNLRGELTEIKSSNQFKSDKRHFIQSMTDSLSQHYLENQEIIRSIILPNLVCYMSLYGYLNFLKELQKFEVKFDIPDYDGRNALHIACEAGQLEVVSFLISQNIKLNETDQMGRSPLYEAILNKHLNIVKELKNAGGKLIANYDDITNLLLNIGYHNVHELLLVFYEAGLKQLNNFFNFDKRTIGHIATNRSSFEVIKCLKEKFDFNFLQKDRWGKTCIDEANDLKNDQILKFIT